MEGATVVANATINLTLSAGAEMKELKRVNGYEARYACELLEALGYQTGTDEEYSDSVPKGCVVRTEPEGGTLLPKDSVVIVYISLGREIREVECPDLVGEKQAKAEKRLRNVNLEVGEVTFDYSDEYKAGIVISQEVEDGTLIEEGTEVSFVVSLGPEPVEENNNQENNNQGNNEDNNQNNNNQNNNNENNNNENNNNENNNNENNNHDNNGSGEGNGGQENNNGNDGEGSGENGNGIEDPDGGNGSDSGNDDDLGDPEQEE